MNPAGLLLGLLAYNYRRHILGRSTICSTLRRLVPLPLAVVLIAVGFGWLIPHYLRGYFLPRIPKESR